MFEWLVAPLRFAFMVRGLIAAISVGVLCSAVGAFVVLRGMTFIGDALAHSVLPGLAVGFISIGKGDRRGLFWWAMGTAILVALGMGWISERTRFREDAAIGIVFAGMFALGIALISTVRGFSVDLVHFLFGNVLGVSNHDLILLGAFGGVVLLLLFLFYKELVLVSFDITLARTLRIRASFYRYLLFVLIAVTVVLSLQTVGIGLMLAMLVTPASTAHLLTKRLPSMLLVGALLGAIAGVIGLYLSFYWGVASGAAIVLVSIAMFLVALVVSSRRELVRRFRRS
ncbi:metal ABC transporter permease [Candidatus Bipolaricaulota bacterium]|jgi:manganese/iron transport system permease protein|nr:metal ABC transporter permease [Candidatus Bipolaricaulota bacterium]